MWAVININGDNKKKVKFSQEEKKPQIEDGPRDGTRTDLDHRESRKGNESHGLS